MNVVTKSLPPYQCFGTVPLAKATNAHNTDDCTINSQLSQWPIQINHACHGRMVYTKIRTQLSLRIDRAQKQESVSTNESIMVVKSNASFKHIFTSSAACKCATSKHDHILPIILMIAQSTLSYLNDQFKSITPVTDVWCTKFAKSFL